MAAAGCRMRKKFCNCGVVKSKRCPLNRRAHRLLLVMMVLALPFAYFQRRAGGVGFRIFAGTMLGLVFFLVGRLFSYLGVINDWPPLFSAAFPIAAFVLFAAGMLWWLERR